MTSDENKRIARNAIYLYGRMLLTIGVSLYTARVVLDVLGVQNYAIYNLVGGIVAVMSFLNGTMAVATQRFLNYEMGIGDAQRLKRTFGNALLIHIGIAVIFLILGETVGLWFVNNHLVISPDRMTAANITYQLSLLTTGATIVQIPYLASVVAHERMDFYALMSILNVMLKLAVALSIMLFATLDSLVVYASLMFLTALIVMLGYRAYCVRKFDECRFTRHTDREIFGSMLRFSGWDLYGNLSFSARMQGTIVILNNFGGEILNAAGNLCLTVSSTITSFAGSVVTAFRPQIIQQYAKGDYEAMTSLIGNCAKFATLLLGLLVVPMFLEIDYILHLWLKEVPQYTPEFCRIALIATFGELTIMAVCVGIHATGRVKWFSFITGSMYLAELPCMWLLLKTSGTPQMVYVVHCCFVGFILLTDTIILHTYVNGFRIFPFWVKGVILPLAIVAGAGVGAWWVSRVADPSFVRALLTALFSAGLIMSGAFFFAIDAAMRSKVINKAKGLVHGRR